MFDSSFCQYVYENNISKHYVKNQWRNVFDIKNGQAPNKQIS